MDFTLVQIQEDNSISLKDIDVLDIYTIYLVWERIFLYSLS